MKKVIGLLVGAMALSGCTHRIGDFTIASTKNMNHTNSNHKVDYDTRVVGKDVKHTVLIFPTGISNMKEAMDNAIEQTPSAVGLSNVTVKVVQWYIPLIYGQSYFEVEGNPIYEVDNTKTK
ncbi:MULTISPECIES: hypothetical protein [Pseudoalteromonas]|uniref:hypothetical protein n=1 Tax=Pseudoalteromonas TaxID=53246 RepID=UPI000231B1A3|nr:MULTISPECIES: hypothetical protein [Pseudoalteromonas]MBB1279241.1 hypothetical protein [Pseudoalteromonas sp. SR41-1]MBB1306062.1 hypothetical protein [Pseudoalteromonas sp. SR43-5]MBB1353495.1 hypothetical protein [Pseudoalteromonas sp. SR45-5]MBB1403360.1 hypothetical protein [Pseudoalteromonas sp. SG45-1]MDN3473804.1 hypothetical protein [Pseudoalteromonas sp. APC 3355]